MCVLLQADERGVLQLADKGLKLVLSIIAAWREVFDWTFH